MIDEQLRELVDAAWDSHRRLNDAPFLVKPSIPILFFGDLVRYLNSPLRVVTVGLNPSDNEFPKGAPYRRFRRAQPSTPKTKGDNFYTEYIGALSDYFRVEPYSWFSCYEPILRGMECSYYGGNSAYDAQPNTALHTDLCSPLATNPTWNGLKPHERTQLEGDGTTLWGDLIMYLDPHVVVASVARWRYERVPFNPVSEWETIYTVYDKVDGTPRNSPYSVQLRRDRFLGGTEYSLVHGTAAHTPFGTVSNAEKQLIGARIKERARGK